MTDKDIISEFNNLNGIFSEVSTVEMTDIVGGSCGGGGGVCPPTNWSPSLPGDPGQFGTTHGFW